MSDTSTAELVLPSHKQEAVSEPSVQDVKDTGILKLKTAARVLHPRRILEHFSKKDAVDIQNARVFAELLHLIQEKGADAATFAVPMLIAVIPMLVGAPDAVTTVAQEASLAAAGGLLGANVGETVRAIQKKDVPNSKKNKLKNAALGAGGLMGAGFAAHHYGGDVARVVLAGGDDLLAPLGAIAARQATKKLSRSAKSERSQVTPAKVK